MTIALKSFARCSPISQLMMTEAQPRLQSAMTVRFFSNLPPPLPTKWRIHSSHYQSRNSEGLGSVKIVPFTRKQKTAFTGVALAVAGFATYKLLEEKSYTKEEVAKHRSKEKGIWVMYQKGVYNVTPFISKHPGGDVFAKVAGKSIDDDWAALPFHAKGPAKKIIQEMRIGKVKTELSDILQLIVKHSQALLEKIGLGGPSTCSGIWSNRPLCKRSTKK
ncbi:MAG: cytochrome b involved in lipid metabolism [Chlamydiales bacterium]|jgi:cytochrome b involved in lipid metabolism